MGEFIRTSAGLANTHLFYSSDFVVYCESHPGRSPEMSWDMGFWRKVLSVFAPESSYTFKPQGGKSSVLAIAAELKDQEGHRSICLIDADFDELHQSLDKGPIVVSTYGYAFENDLCDPDVIASAIDVALPGITSLIEIRAEVSTKRSEAESAFRWPVVADMILSLYFLSFFDRDGSKFKSVCTVRGTSCAKLDRGIAIKRIAEMKQKRNNKRDISSPSISVDTWRWMLGHLCWWLNYRISLHIMSRRGHGNMLPEDTFAGLCMNMFAIKLADESWAVSKHYNTSVTRALAAAA